MACADAARQQLTAASRAPTNNPAPPTLLVASHCKRRSGVCSARPGHPVPAPGPDSARLGLGRAERSVLLLTAAAPGFCPAVVGRGAGGPLRYPALCWPPAGRRRICSRRRRAGLLSVGRGARGADLRPGPRAPGRNLPCIPPCTPPSSDQRVYSTPPSSEGVNTTGRGSRGSGFETCSGVWYPGGALAVWPSTNTSADLIESAEESPGFNQPCAEPSTPAAIRTT